MAGAASVSIVLDIVKTYVQPREVQARRMSGEVREDRALVSLFAACGLIFVAQWPRLSREAFLDPSIPFDARLAGALFGWLMLMPLVFYVLSLLLQLVLRVLGQRPHGYCVRSALFWALLASTPLWLLAGLMLGFAGTGTGSVVTGALALGAFLIFVLAGLMAASRTGIETTV
jgi:hypothetical protein